MYCFVVSLPSEPQKWWQATECHYYDLTGEVIFTAYGKIPMYLCTLQHVAAISLNTMA